MAKISKLSVGQVLYTISRFKMGNTTGTRVAVHEVQVVSIDPAGKFVVAKWNHNPQRTYLAHHVDRWLINKPKMAY